MYSLSGIIVPLYSYPGDAWKRVAQAKLANPSVSFVVVINPNNGPGSSFDANYAKGTEQLQSAGVTVLGYTYTKYAHRLPSSVLSDIESYMRWYKVDGVLFDEMSNLAGLEGYYSDLRMNAKAMGCKFTFGNPGTKILPSYLETVDNLVIYENRGIPSPTSLRTLTMGQEKSHFSCVSYGVSQLDSFVVARTSAYVGYVFMTGANKRDAYCSLPDYFDVLVSILARTSTPKIEHGYDSFVNLIARMFQR